MTLVHTDVDDYAPLLREVARVVAPGGTVVHVGVHPCFVGHHIEAPDRSEERLAVVPGYRDGGWVLEHENFGPGVRARIGARHVPLAELLNAFARGRPAHPRGARGRPAPRPLDAQPAGDDVGCGPHPGLTELCRCR